MAGFASPGVLFVGGVHQLEREFMRIAIKRLWATGVYTSTVEPCCGAMAMSSVAREAGVPAQAIRASDITLFSAIIGTYLAGDPLQDLGICLDGEPVYTPSEPTQAAAWLLYLQVLYRLRAQAKGQVYWLELLRDLEEREDDHVEYLAVFLQELAKRFSPGFQYSAEGMWEHMRRAADDPEAILLLNAPVYKAGYEKFFNTGGRITWNEPPYELWEPGADPARVFEESKDWAATLFYIEPTVAGHCLHPRPIYAHEARNGRAYYVWTNRPDLVAGLLALETRGLAVGDYERLGYPVLPPDHQISPASEIGAEPIKASQGAYYRHLFSHGEELKAGKDFAVVVDGYLAGIGGYAASSLKEPESKLQLLYALGPAPELVRRVACTRQLLELCLNPLVVAAATEVEIGDEGAEIVELRLESTLEAFLSRSEPKIELDGPRPVSSQSSASGRPRTALRA